MRAGKRASTAQTGEFLQNVPVLEAIFHGAQKGLRRIAVFVEVLGKPAFAAGEIDEVYRLLGLGIDVPIFFETGIALQGQVFLDRFAVAGSIDEEREGVA